MPQRKHNRQSFKNNRLILFEEINAVYSDNHTKPINIICGQNAELLTDKAGGTYCLLPLGIKEIMTLAREESII